MQHLHVSCPACLTVNRVPGDKLSLGGKCGKCRSPLFTGEPLELTSRNFDAIVNHTDVPLVIDFWAAWCGPCRLFAPVFAESAKVLEPQVRLAKLDTEAHPQLASRFNVCSIPTLVILERGREVGRTSGALSGSQFQSWVRSVSGS